MHDLARYFIEPLVDLGDVESTAFAGVLTPKAEIGQKREGVNAAFLDDAEDYYIKHQGFDYWKGLFSRAFHKMGISEASLIVEYGCGFGNATLPLFELMPRASIIASDISPNLLAIAKRLVDARGLSEQCLLVAMDAQKPYIQDGVADLVAGSAILHHLADPHSFVKAATRVLKPKGCAIFFEPFELGYALIRMLCLNIVDEAKRRDETSPAIEWLPHLAQALDLQIKRDGKPGWRDLDDKWVFPRWTLQQIADECDAELIVYSLEGGGPGKFRGQFSYMLTNFRSLELSSMPDWAWALIDRMDQDIFSPSSMHDVMVGGAVIFRKR